MRTMATTTFTGRVGMEERMIEHLKKNAKELEARGLNVAYWIARLQALVDSVKAADARQEALKAELKASTASLNATDREAYVATSGAIDAAVGAWGKSSSDGRVLARMRSKLHRADAGVAVLPVETPPR